MFLQNNVNRPRSTHQYSNMPQRLSGQTSIFGVFFMFQISWELRDERNIKNLQLPDFYREGLGTRSVNYGISNC